MHFGCFPSPASASASASASTQLIASHQHRALRPPHDCIDPSHIRITTNHIPTPQPHLSKMVRLEEVEDETFVEKPEASRDDVLLADDDADYTDTGTFIRIAHDPAHQPRQTASKHAPTATAPPSCAASFHYLLRLTHSHHQIFKRTPTD